jgi:high affinity choline transporter 7
MAQIDYSGVAVVAGMYVVFLGIGWLAARRVKQGTADELIVAGRAMPLWVAVMTMTATWVDGGYLLGTAEYTYKHGLAFGAQGGVCFGISLIVGGLLFAAKMRRLGYSTMIDPLEDRFGHRWAAVLFVPALLGELFWSGALLVAIGSTFGVLLNLDLKTAILTSAAVVTLYTMLGGMWSVALTDAFQLGLIPLGLLIALPFALSQVGGWDACLQTYEQGKQTAALWLPPASSDAYWSPPGIIAWWDMTIMLVLGGIPWNCYFQRVLSCETPGKARSHSILAGMLTIALTLPPLVLGMAAFAHFGAGGNETASTTLPLLLKQTTPYVVMLLGLAAIIGAVTSSFSASILSAGSMFSWNVYRRLLTPRDSAAGDNTKRLKHVIRASIVLLGVAAAVMALSVKSVAALWLFTGDLVFVLLFPQLVAALFDRRANWIGSVAAFCVALVLRLGGGMSIETDAGLIGFRAVVPYAEIFSPLLSGNPSDWYDSVGATLFPVKTVAALAGLITLPVVSRLTAAWCPARQLREPVETSP